MSYEPNDPLASASKGITEGVLGWSSERIKQWVVKFNNRELLFIKDIDTIERAKEQRTKSEWALFSQYVDDNELRILFQMGLTLRGLEKNKLQKQLENLRKKIFNKYHKEGLHIANFVQNGLFSKYNGNILERVPNTKILKREITDLFRNMQKTVAFISKKDDPKQKADEIISKIYTNNPETFILSSCHSGAMNNCKIIKDLVIDKTSNNYQCEVYLSPQKEIKEIYFLNRRKDDELLD